ncbi:helix-turn-helix domain-containing protein [Pseudoprimorskyibacter insulae]|uniref:HTH-type transcriptional activator Btr n=1 Tax=Pseudoprimorskyibacter insulae TaxID=1695997 RepID=A0A2R8AUJ5_9RHOB|nr:helix-turn-helix domain-containing protein [Pseudoprimorskyibacter insulae]SPF79577.1 HTH-type transcriptional activator Btr [Pseudoprimorskyibacter insulae]
MTTIQTYNLFGEVGDLPDVVHCETIEARSRLHDWEFAPHRHARLHQVLLLQCGSGRMTMDGEPLDLGENSVVNVPMGCVHGFNFTPGTTGHVVTLPVEILDVVLHPAEGLRQVLARPAVVSARPNVVNTIEQISINFARRDFARAQVLRSLTGLLLGQIARDLAGDQSPAEQGQDLLARFQSLLEKHYRDHWTVADYAKALAKTPTHLSRLTRTATGQPATALIEERLIREARRNLVYTNLPVSTIAYELGFKDPAYFSRVFTRATGMPPSAFRSKSARP